LNFKKIKIKINKNNKITDLFEIKRDSLLKYILNILKYKFIRYIIILQLKKIIKKLKIYKRYYYLENYLC